MQGKESRSGATARRRSRESGSQVVEASLVFIPMLLMTFLMLDLSMVIFLRTTMQEAVREGTRYAITGQNTTGPCQDDSIKTVVKSHALGYLGSTAGAATVHVQFINPYTGGQGNNAPGNIVNVKVEGYKYNAMAPFQRINQALYIYASASDLIEPYSGAAPCLTNSSDQ
jgi:Flp pilus assembly protein TadG